MGLQSDGKIVIAGDFTSVNQVARTRIARLNADGSLDTAFNVGTGVTGSAGSSVYVGDLALQSDGKAVFCGKFTSVNGNARSGIARLNTDGSADTGFAPTGVTGGSAVASGLAIQTNGSIVIGGRFTRVNGSSRTNIARLTAAGSLDSGFINSKGTDFDIYAVALQSDNKVLIGGQFNTVDGVARTAIARLTTTGALDGTFDPGAAPRHTTYSISVQSDGQIVLGNLAIEAVYPGNYMIERLDTTGQQDPAFASSAGAAVGNILASAIMPDGKLVIGGDFDAVDGINRKSIARFNTDGSLDTSFDPGTGPSGSIESVKAIAAQSDGKVVIGGAFTSYNGTARNRIARLNTDGSLDTDFNPGTGFNSRVFSLALQTDGKIIVGGGFTTYNSQSGKQYLVRLNTNASLDTTFAIGTGPNASVYATALQSDGKILLGGPFSSINGTNRNGRARLLSSGVVDTNFLPVSVSLCDVRSCVVQPDGKVWFGGYFYYTGSDTNWTTFQRLNPNGSLDAKILTGTEIAELGLSSAPLPDGSTLVGGGFFSSSYLSPARLGLVTAAGTIDPTSTPSNPIIDQVYTLNVVSNTTIFCGGDFTSVYQQPRYGLARMLNIRPNLSIGPNPGLNTFQFNLNGHPGRTYRIESSTNLVHWTTFTTVTSDGVNAFQAPPGSPRRFFRAVTE
ncbi:MAG: delta-60 repeat domain-containing protein [Verrucomicrobiota bacterium]